MSSPTTLSNPIVDAGHAVDRYTLGEIRRAGNAIGVPDLVARVIEGQKRFCYAACRFLTRDTEDCAKCPERAECHGAFPI